MEGLSFEPVVATGPTEENITDASTRFDIGWESQAVAHYNNPAGFRSLPAEDGPADWARVSTLASLDGDPVTPAQVSDIVVGRNSVSFSVDRIGTPVLVKVSYFPNWDVTGADGPYRAGPNLMVVVPTANDVELNYGYTSAEYLSFLFFAMGCAGAVLLALDRARANRRGDDAGISARVDDGVDERLEPDLFAKLLAESGRDGALGLRADNAPTPANPEVGLADRMLGALEAEGTAADPDAVALALDDQLPPVTEEE
ncbi:MAG: hypothetical protein HKN24_11710 [Acidimicrobiales bacterium]|nr:hypothetical protein [Acidimicrobiales bacterium]